MRYVAAYLLAALGGKASPSAEDVKAILASVGIEADEAKLSKVCCGLCPFPCAQSKCFCSMPSPSGIPWLTAWQVVKELNGKDINAVIAEGEKKLASVPSGGAAAPAAAAPAAAAAGGKKEEKKEEKKKEEKKEESDGDMGFGLFD
jgi:large subunit ribosomal protein LP2